jgi:hypothetical protein
MTPSQSVPATAAGCPRLVKISREATGDKIRFSPDDPCKCECKIGDNVTTVYRVLLEAQLIVVVDKSCDRAWQPPIFDDGCDIAIQGSFDGTFHIDTPPTSGTPVRLFDGILMGTEGGNPSEDTTCCEPFGRGIGSMRGKGVNKLAGWTLCASYRWEIPRAADLPFDKLCDEFKCDGKLAFQGILIGPCRPIDGVDGSTP